MIEAMGATGSIAMPDGARGCRPAASRGLFGDDFSRAFADVLHRAGVSRYQISQYTGLDQGYLSRLQNGDKSNPSPETVMKLCLALAHYCPAFSLSDAERLFGSVGRSLTPRRSRRYS